LSYAISLESRLPYFGSISIHLTLTAPPGQPSQSSGRAGVDGSPTAGLRPLVGRSGTTSSFLLLLFLFPFLFLFLTLTYLSTSICLIDQFCAYVVEGRPPRLGQTGRLNWLPLVLPTRVLVGALITGHYRILCCSSSSSPSPLILLLPPLRFVQQDYFCYYYEYGGYVYPLFEIKCGMLTTGDVRIGVVIAAP